MLTSSIASPSKLGKKQSGSVCLLSGSVTRLQQPVSHLTERLCCEETRRIVAVSQRPQFLHGTNIDLGCMCQDQTTSTVDWHHLLTLPAHAALRPNPLYSTSVRHEPAETAGRKQLIPQCSAGLRSGLHNLSQTGEPIHPTPFGANGAGLEGGLWSQTVEVTAGGGTSQHLSALTSSPLTGRCGRPRLSPSRCLHTWCSSCNHSRDSLAVFLRPLTPPGA